MLGSSPPFVPAGKGGVHEPNAHRIHLAAVVLLLVVAAPAVAETTGQIVGVVRAEGGGPNRDPARRGEGPSRGDDDCEAALVIGPEEDGLTRGSIDMPSFWNLDLTIGKLWKIKNRVGIELRADIFNVFNQQPVLTIQDRSTDTFGEPLSRQAPRSVRLYGTMRF